MSAEKTKRYVIVHYECVKKSAVTDGVKSCQVLAELDRIIKEEDYCHSPDNPCKLPSDLDPQFEYWVCGAYYSGIYDEYWCVNAQARVLFESGFKVRIHSSGTLPTSNYNSSEIRNCDKIWLDKTASLHEREKFV